MREPKRVPGGKWTTKPLTARMARTARRAPMDLHPSVNMLSDAHYKLNGQIVKATAASKIKTEVCSEVSEAINLIRGMRNMLCDEATTTFIAMRAEMKELKTSMKGVKEATKAKTTYTQAAIVATTKCSLDPRERARRDVTLIATTDNTKKNLATSTYRVITKKIQMAIDDNGQHYDKPLDKLLLLGVRKPTKDGTVRIRCRTEEANTRKAPLTLLLKAQPKFYSATRPQSRQF